MEEKLKSKIIAEQWEKGSDTNKARLRRYRMIVETFAFNCMEALEKEVFNPKLSQIEKELKEKMRIQTAMDIHRDIEDANKRHSVIEGYREYVLVNDLQEVLNKIINKGK